MITGGMITLSGRPRVILYAYITLSNTISILYTQKGPRVNPLARIYFTFLQYSYIKPESHFKFPFLNVFHLRLTGVIFPDFCQRVYTTYG